MKIWLLGLLSTLMIMPGIALAQKDNLVKVAIGDIYKGSPLEADLKNIYQAAGIEADFTYLPNERAIQSVISGQYDALGLRIDTLDKEESLIRVNVPLQAMSVHLLSVNGDFYQSLDNVSDKTLVSILGARYSDMAKSYKKLHLVQSEQQAALMLTKKRADVWLAAYWSYLNIKDEFPDIKVASPSIHKQYLYHYLNVSKSHLIEPLEVSANAFNQARSFDK
ncbi:transporter substrate-binding domain-containing protein [Vibrio hepatarius]|uniref:transporter substrate-binding domain-containing protein n=1 Tax=Vibrio hepatarius TaxID=171383 RepID=UPI001C09CDB7|nr:transporter substrate-binding domain-containing protein [Vibrio hepatarius]MBU2897749.1 transporter substrate-binding domain-containing protein [Vibrio hepatarius]